MKTISISLALACIALTGCSGPSLATRIDEGMVAFDSWPIEVQEKVKAGEIEVGFDREQVRMAWGEPDLVQENAGGIGDSEIWLWEKKTPRIGIGIGVGSYGRHSGVSGSVGTSVGGDIRVKKEVVFKDGKVDSYSN